MKKTPVIIGTLIALLAISLAAQERKDVKKIIASPKTLHLEYTYFIGGSGDEDLGWLRSPYIDREGILYITGTTKSPDFPVTPDALDSTYHGGNNWGMEDIFLIKFNTRQPGIAYSTFLGGAKGPEFVADLCLDRAKNVHLAGNTGSSDFPTTVDALIKEFRGPDFRHADGFITILGKNGRKMKYSSFLGGSGNDWILQQFIEPSGELTLFGITDSRDFPTTEAAPPAYLKKAPALFMMKLDAKGSRVLSSRLLANSWSVDVQRLDSGDFLIAGNTNNPELPTTEGAYNRRYNGGNSEAGGDIFVMRLSADLKTTAFMTLFGGAGEESSPRLVEVRGGDIIVAGRTTSKDLPVTANASERTLEGKDALFLARFSGDGKRLKYCTYLGTKGEDYNSAAIAYDGKSRVYAVASTTSPRFPVTPDALCATHKGGRDGLVLLFNVDSNSIEYSSYLGGSKDDGATNLALGEDGAVYVLGYTNSDDFPTLEKTPAPKKGTDVFISKFSIGTVAEDSRNNPLQEIK